MKNISLIILSVFIMIATAESLFSQKDTIFSKKEFSSGTIFRKERKGTYKFENLVIQQDSIRFKNSYSKKLLTFPFNDIDKIDIKAGNRSLPYGIAGGLYALSGWTGLMLGIIISEPNSKFDPPSLPYTGGLICTVFGFGVGYIWGLFVPEEKTIYENNKFITKFILFDNNRMNCTNNILTLKFNY